MWSNKRDKKKKNNRAFMHYRRRRRSWKKKRVRWSGRPVLVLTPGLVLNLSSSFLYPKKIFFYLQFKWKIRGHQDALASRNGLPDQRTPKSSTIEEGSCDYHCRVQKSSHAKITFFRKFYEMPMLIIIRYKAISKLECFKWKRF